MRTQERNQNSGKSERTFCGRVFVMGKSSRNTGSKEIWVKNPSMEVGQINNLTVVGDYRNVDLCQVYLVEVSHDHENFKLSEWEVRYDSQERVKLPDEPQVEYEVLAKGYHGPCMMFVGILRHQCAREHGQALLEDLVGSAENLLDKLSDPEVQGLVRETLETVVEIASWISNKEWEDAKMARDEILGEFPQNTVPMLVEGELVAVG